MLICIFFFSPLYFFLPFANRSSEKESPFLKFLPPPPNPSLHMAHSWYVALHSCRYRAKTPPHCPQPVLATWPHIRVVPAPQGQTESQWQGLSSAAGLSHGEAIPLHPGERRGKSTEGDKDYL